MDSPAVVDSLVQVLYVLAATFGAVAVVELVLFWALYKHKRSTFILESLLLSVCVGAVVFGLALSIGIETQAALQNGAVALSIFLIISLIGRFVVRGRHALPIMMLAPAIVAVSFLIVYPFFFEFRLAFANLNLYTIADWLDGGDLGWVGFRHFINVFTTSPLQTISFWGLLGRTLIWTVVNLVFHVSLGLALALLLNRIVRARSIYRTFLIIPWAMPQVVAVLAWRGEFHPQFGFVNVLLRYVGIEGINWWSDPLPVFISCCIVNIWLGIPFMMVVFLGGLQSIPKSYYEAASIDGASKLTQFREITIPLLKPVVVPSVTLGTIWTFNNINVIYLMTGQNGGNEYADILVSAWYKSAFSYSRYSFSAAFAVVIFFILLFVTLIWMKISKGTEYASR